MSIMGKVINLADFKYPWREAFKADGASSTLQVYTNDRTGELEVVQMNDEGESIRTTMDATDAAIFRASVANQWAKASGKK